MSAKVRKQPCQVVLYRPSSFTVRAFAEVLSNTGVRCFGKIHPAGWTPEQILESLAQARGQWGDIDVSCNTDGEHQGRMVTFRLEQSGANLKIGDAIALVGRLMDLMESCLED